MDKIATNNHFVVLKKEAKKAKAMVIGNLIRKINKHKKDQEKLEDEVDDKKIEGKISKIHEEIKLLKSLDLYQIAKRATLRPDIKHWEKVISDNSATTEVRLMGRVICKNNVQKQVNKFRDDHADCDEWLNEYIEYREKKRELKEKTTFKKRSFNTKPRRQDSKFSKNNPQPAQKKQDEVDDEDESC